MKKRFHGEKCAGIGVESQDQAKRHACPSFPRLRRRFPSRFRPIGRAHKGFFEHRHRQKQKKQDPDYGKKEAHAELGEFLDGKLLK